MSEEKKYVTNFTFPNGETFYIKDEEAQGAPGGVDAQFDSNTGTLTLIPDTSPTIEVSGIAGGHRVTVKDGKTPMGTSFDVLNGEDGQGGGAYITPEYYGAIGDGIADDTAAWQAAVDSGRNIVTLNKTYKCGTINVTKNIEIDCRWAEFICTGETLFNCTGRVTESVAGADYVANEPYTLLNDDKYTGFALLRSRDNVITMREYYYGGFVTMFAKGVCNERVPIGFTGVTVDKILPITCNVKNVGYVQFTENITGNNKNTVVKCTYGLACNFDGFSVDGDYYSTVRILKSYACRIANVYGFQTYTGAEVNYYALGLNDSSNCIVEDCDFTSDWWSAYDIGGNLFCIGNKAKNCKFHAGQGAVAYGEHSNALFSYLENCEFDNADVNAGAMVINCTINENRSNKSSDSTDCRLNLKPVNIIGVNRFKVDGLKLNFITDSAMYIGVRVWCTAYTTGNHFYLDELNVSHLSANNEAFAKRSTISLSPYSAAGDFTINGDIILDDVVGSFYLHATSVYPNVNFANKSKLIVKNCKKYLSNGDTAFLLGTSASHRYPPFVEVRDSDINLNGIFEELRLFNVFSKNPYYTMGALTATTLYANNVGRLQSLSADMLASFTKAVVTNMRYTETILWTYLYINNGAGNYGLLSANGIENKALS